MIYRGRCAASVLHSCETVLITHLFSSQTNKIAITALKLTQGRWMYLRKLKVRALHWATMKNPPLNVYAVVSTMNSNSLRCSMKITFLSIVVRHLRVSGNSLSRFVCHLPNKALNTICSFFCFRKIYLFYENFIFGLQNRFRFTGECDHPDAKITSCQTAGTQFLITNQKFNITYKQCQGMAGTFNGVVEYSCLGDWFVGKNHYFAVANTKESRKDEKYRCFLKNRDDDLYIGVSITAEWWVNVFFTLARDNKASRLKKASLTSKFNKFHFAVIHWKPLKKVQRECV